jgi:lycopene cyclase domain-containing protein
VNYLYLLINLSSVIVPLIFSFHPKLQFYKRWNQLFPALFLSAIVFIPWDIYFTKKGVWGFNSGYVSGIYFFQLPVEEILFFLCIPYACMFTYHCLNLLVKKTILKCPENPITVALLFFLFSTGIFFIHRQYTSVTFIALGVLIFTLKYLLKVPWLGRFYFTYLILLVPFTLVNGILTGTALDKPIVWYNNNENMGLRLLTIPFEDVFYGMLLFLLNVTVFEFPALKNAA